MSANNGSQRTPKHLVTNIFQNIIGRIFIFGELSL